MPLEGILNWWKNWNSKRVDERMIEDAPPTPVVIVGAQGSGGELVFGANALEGPTLGGQAAINTTNTSINTEMQNLNAWSIRIGRIYPENADGAGNHIVATSSSAALANGWIPIPSVVGASTVITADGAGNIGAAAEVIAAITGLKVDAWMICQVDTTGSYTTKWCEASGSPAVTTPDYNTAGHIAYMVAGYPYLLRITTVNDAVNIGYNTGVNGNWPNSANMYITGWYRGI